MNENLTLTELEINEEKKPLLSGTGLIALNFISPGAIERYKAGGGDQDDSKSIVKCVFGSDFGPSGLFAYFRDVKWATDFHHAIESGMVPAILSLLFICLFVLHKGDCTAACAKDAE